MPGPLQAPRRALLALALLLGAVLWPAPARAEQEVKLKQAAFRISGDQLTVTVGFRELFTPAAVLTSRNVPSPLLLKS